MLTKLRITFKNADINDINVNASSLFHGFIMQVINCEYAEILHENNIKPYSQHICIENNKPVWEINTLTEEAYIRINKVLYDNVNSVYLKQRNSTLYVDGKAIETLTYEDLHLKNHNIDYMKGIRFAVCTPMSFKENGRYINYFDTLRFFASIIRRYGYFSGTTLDSKMLLNYINENIEISEYILKSTFFHVEGVKIPAFVGELRLNLIDRKNRDFNEIISTLIDFAEFSSVGIKTALGMGSVHRLN